MANVTMEQMAKVVPNKTRERNLMRRMIAEDPEYNLAKIPPLVELCLKHIVENFADNPVLKELLPRHQKNVLDNLPVNIPLSVTSALISDQDYWQKCCKVRWEICDVSLYGNSWKRMFLERNSEELIENYVPGTTDLNNILDTLKLSGKYVHCLKIRQLLPPVKKPKIEDDLSDSGSDNDDVPAFDHFDFNAAVPLLPHLEELHLVYGVRNCGVNFEWHLFEFTLKDCALLGKALKAWQKLKGFHLQRSRVDDKKARILINHLLDHPSLQTLDFSYNKLLDSSARAIGKLLNGHSQLVTLFLEDNCISIQGAGSIAHALKHNKTLKTLSLRLNTVEDEGCEKICQALLINTTLVDLHLGGNNITEKSSVAIGKVLINNTALVSLNLSCNSLKDVGGKTIQEGLEDNSTITKMDLRLTDIGHECEYNINMHVKKNRDKLRLNSKK